MKNEGVIYVAVIAGESDIPKRALEGVLGVLLLVEQATDKEVQPVIAMTGPRSLEVAEALARAFRAHGVVGEKEEDFLKGLPPDAADRYPGLVERLTSTHFNQPNPEEKVTEVAGLVVRIGGPPSPDSEKPTIVIPNGNTGQVQVFAPGGKESVDFADFLYQLKETVEAEKRPASPSVG